MAKGSDAVRASATKAVCFRSAIGKRAMTRLMGPLGSVLVGLGLLPYGGTAAALGAMLVATGLTFAIWIAYRYVRYLIVGDTLVIQRAIGKRRIPLASIDSVRQRAYAEIWATHRPSDDFALGTNMLEIHYDGDSKILVSPRDENAFLKAIGQTPVADPR